MKHLIRIIIIAILALGISIGLWMYLNGSLIKSKADVNTANLRFAPTTNKVNDGVEVGTSIMITASGNPTFSGVDLSFTNTGNGLEFVRYTLPTGFTESKTTTSKKLTRLVFVAAKASGSLPTSITIPLFFRAVVPNNDRTATPQISVNVSTSQVVGPGGVYSVVSDPTASSFKISFNPPPSDSATSLECDVARNMSASSCGQSVSFTWTDAMNEEGYRISRNGVLLSTISKDSTSFTDTLCNFNASTYSVQAFNQGGSSATAPTVDCACLICPTKAPPAPTPIPPPSSSDLMFHLVFPDAAASVNEISNVKITIFDSNGKSICKDGMDCVKIVTFQRDTAAKTPNTFNSPRLGYEFEKNQAYTIVVKQPHTVEQTYKRVYLTWKDVLQCFEGTQDSRCGDLIGDVANRPLISGDLDNSNKVDQADLDIINKSLGTNSPEGDLNFDNKTDQRDLNIVTKNFDKSGT